MLRLLVILALVILYFWQDHLLKILSKRAYKCSILTITTLKKRKAEINAWKFQNIYIRSDTILVTNHNFRLNDVFTKILNLLDVWQGEGSGWIIDQVQHIHIYINNFDPFAGSSYIQLPTPLRNSMKGLINIKNRDIECLKYSHVRMLNPQERNPDRIKKEDKKNCRITRLPRH